MILLEAGHVAQNLNLVTAALECGSVNLAGFYDAALGEQLGLDRQLEVPLYALAVGPPCGGAPAPERE